MYLSTSGRFMMHRMSLSMAATRHHPPQQYALVGSRRLLSSSQKPPAMKQQQSSSSPPPPPPSSSSSNNFVWQLGTAAALVLTYVGVNAAMNFSQGSSTTDEYDDLVDGPVPPQAAITSRVYFDIAIDDQPAGRIVMGLHGGVVPRTVHNFETLCRGTERHPHGRLLAYQGSIFHRIIPNFMIQGGDFTNFNGTGGMSVYGDKFADENFQLRHTGPGILSMANAGRNTNGSQFFITTTKTKHLDGRHVVFGVVLDGWKLLKRIESFGSNSGTPSRRVSITKAGVLDTSDDVDDDNSK